MSQITFDKNLILNHNRNRLNSDGININNDLSVVLNDVISETTLSKGVVGGGSRYELNRFEDLTDNTNGWAFRLEDGLSDVTRVIIRDSILQIKGSSGYLFSFNGTQLTPQTKYIDIIDTKVTSFQDGAILAKRESGNVGPIDIRLKNCEIDPTLITGITFGSNLKIYGNFYYITPSGDMEYYTAEGTTVRRINDPSNASTSGMTMSGDIDMNSHFIVNPGVPTAGNQVGDRDYNDGRYLSSSATYTSSFVGLGNVTNHQQLRTDQLITVLTSSADNTTVASSKAIVDYINTLNFGRKFAYPTATSLATHDAQVGDVVFITDDGDGKWAQYNATTSGVGATWVKIMDEDLLLNSINGASIKAALFAEPDTNNFSDSYKSWIDNFTISNATNSTSETDVASSLAVKNAYDLANHSHPYLNESTGGTVQGAVNVYDNFVVSGDSGNKWGVSLSNKAGQKRWYWGTDGESESGSSNGSDLQLERYDDSGALLGVVYTVDRSTGDIEFNTEVTFTGITYLTNIYGTSQVSSNGATPLGIYGGSYLVVQSTNETYFDAGTMHLWRDGANVERMRLDTTAGTLTLQGSIIFGDGAARSITGPTNEDIKIIAKPNAVTEGIKYYVDGTGTVPIVEMLQTGQTAFRGALSGAGMNSSEIRLGDGSNSSAFDLFIGLNDDGVNFRNNSSGRGFNFKNSNTTLASLSSLGEFSTRNVRTSTSNPDANTMYRNSTNNALYVRNYGSGDIARFGNGTTEDLIKINNGGLLKAVQVHVSGASATSVPLVVERPGSVSGNAVGIDFKTDHITNSILSDNVNGFRFRMQANSAYDMKLSPVGVLTISDSVVVPKIDLGSYAIINKLSNDIHMQVPGVLQGAIAIKSSDGIEKGYLAFDNIGFGLKNNSNQWMLRGSHDSQDVYFHADTWYAGAWNSIGSRPVTGSGDYGYFPIVKGGNYSVDTSNQVGYLKISLPVLWTNHMLSFSLDIYDYKTNNAITFILGGYNNIGSDWVAPNVTQIGGIKEYPVIFGDDGSKACIWIGDINEDWDYVKATIRDVTVGYSGITNSVWSQGWSINVSSAAIPSTDHTVTGHRLLDSKVPKLTSELSVNNSFHVGNSPKKGNFGTNTYGVEIGEGFSTIHQGNSYGQSLYIVTNAYWDDAASTYRRSGSTKISNRIVLSDYSGFVIQSEPAGATDSSFYHSKSLFRIDQNGYLYLNGTRKDDYWDAKYGQGSSPTFNNITTTGQITSPLGRYGVGFSGSETDILYIKNNSHDARVVIDGHTGFDAELKFAVSGNFHSTIGWDSATSKFVIGGINVDAPWVTVSSNGNMQVYGNIRVTNSSTGVRHVAFTEDNYYEQLVADAADIQLILRRGTNNPAMLGANASGELRVYTGANVSTASLNAVFLNNDLKMQGGFSTYNESRTITTPSTEFNTVIGSSNLRTLALNGVGTSSMWWAGNGIAQAGIDSSSSGGLAFWSYNSGWTKTLEYNSTSLIIHQDTTLRGNTKNFNIINDLETASGITISDGQDSNQHGKFLYDCGTQTVRIERDNSVGVSLDSDGVNIHQKMNVGANKEATIEFNTTENSIDFIIN